MKREGTDYDDDGNDDHDGDDDEGEGEAEGEGERGDDEDVSLHVGSDSPGHLEEKVSQLENMLKRLQDDLQKVSLSRRHSAGAPAMEPGTDTREVKGNNNPGVMLICQMG